MPLLTFMITTHNRIGELQKTLAQCLSQARPQDEIIVVDDASVDGTSELLRERFPKVILIRNEKNKGSIASRNDILRRASGDYIIALDDDSRLVDNDACERIINRMDAEPDIGILSLQVIGPEFPESQTGEGRLRGEWHTNSFACCGAVIRRSMLQKTGLLPAFFFHAYEEPDLALRAWDAGYRVVQWNDILVYHEFTPMGRNEQRTHRRHARNEACSVWMRYPWYLVLPVTIVRLIQQSRYAFRRGWILWEPRVWIEFLWRLPKAIYHRRAVNSSTVKLCLAMNRRRVVSAEEAWGLGKSSWRNVLSRQQCSSTKTPSKTR